MRWLKMLIGVWVGVPVLLLLLAGCGKRETGVERGFREKVLLLGNGAEPVDLDPQVSVAYTDANIHVALFEGLTVMDEKTSRPLPGMAERWEILEEGLVYRFYLRVDAKWSSGEAVVAEDFVFSFRRILSPKLGARYAEMLHVIKGAREFNEGKLKQFEEVGVRAIGERMLEIRLREPVAYLLSLAAHTTWLPVHRGSVLKWGAMDDPRNPWARKGGFACNGAFVLEEWKVDQFLRVKKNGLYYGATENGLEGVVFYPVSDVATDERNFRSEQVHLTYDVLPGRLAAWRREAPECLRVDPLLETFFLRFNVGRKPLDDVRVRRALSLAIDRDAIARVVMQGTRLPGRALVPPDAGGYRSRVEVPVDFARARELLKEAGFEGGKGFPKLEVKMNADPVNGQILEAIQELWRRELGIEVGLAQQEYRVYLSAMQAVDFDILRSRWVGDYVDPSTFTDLFVTGGGNNNTGWSSAEYDRLVEAAAGERDEERRFEVLAKAEGVLLEEAPIAPVIFGARTYLIHRDVKGWEASVLGIHRYQTIRLER